MLPPPVLVEPQHRTMLRESAASFIAVAGTPARVRAVRKTDDGFDRAIWREMAELGWVQLSQPEEHGGLGLQIADMAALHEELGKGALPEPMAAVTLAAMALSLGENARLREDRLPALQVGEALATLVWQSAPGALTADDVAIQATAAGDGYRLDGEGVFVPLAASADAFVVAARSDDGVGLFWVERGQAGLSVKIARAADYSPIGQVTLERVAVAEAACISAPGPGGFVLDQVLDRGRVAICAEAVGVMHQTLSTTVDYMKQREQFGKPIGAFQALQHRAVDLYIQTELSRSVVMRAAAALDAGDPDAPAKVAACKARCAEAGVMIAGQSVHLHGTIGFTEDLDLSLLIRRAHVLSAWLGNSAAHRRRYTQLRFPDGVAA